MDCGEFLLCLLVNVSSIGIIWSLSNPMFIHESEWMSFPKQMQSLYFLFPFMLLLGTNTPSNAIILLHVNIVSLLLQRHV